MIINLHMEKAGGTSVRRFFEKALGRMYFRVLSHDLNRSMLELKRYQNKYLIAHGHVFYGVHSELGCEPLYETVLRNPLDRFYSQYKHVTSRAGSPIFKQFGNMDYSAFLDKYGERFGNIQTRRICGKLDEEPLDLSDLRLAIKRLKTFNRVGICENLETYLSSWAKELSVVTPVTINENCGGYDDDLSSKGARCFMRTERLNNFDIILYEEAKGMSEQL